MPQQSNRKNRMAKAFYLLCNLFAKKLFKMELPSYSLYVLWRICFTENKSFTLTQLFLSNKTNSIESRRFCKSTMNGSISKHMGSTFELHFSLKRYYLSWFISCMSIIFSVLKYSSNWVFCKEKTNVNSRATLRNPFEPRICLSSFLDSDK